VKDQNRKDTTNLIRLLEDLGKKAAGRGDDVNEAYLNGLAEGLALSDMVNHDQVQVMTRWSQILANQQIRATSLLPMPHRLTTNDASSSAY
jgi:hypothetical protein